MSVNFNDLVSMNLDDIKVPPALPEGTFHGVITSFELGDNNRNKTPYVRFSLKLQSAGDDIDSKDMEGIDLATRKLSTDFYLTPEAQWRLKEFMESLGITGMTLNEAFPETIGQNVLIYVTQRFNPERPNDPPRNNVKNVKAA